MTKATFSARGRRFTAISSLRAELSSRQRRDQASTTGKRDRVYFPPRPAAWAASLRASPKVIPV